MPMKTLMTLSTLFLCTVLRAGDTRTLALEACRQAADALATEMSQTLHDDILEKGITGAVSSCAERVKILCQEHSSKPGLTIERTSLLQLKEQKRFNSFEAQALRLMIDAAREGKELKEEDFQWKETSSGGAKGIYIRAIKVDPLCLICHGPANMVQPDVKTIMREKYHALPSGNQVGEVKGALVVSIELPKGRALLKPVEAKKNQQK